VELDVVVTAEDRRVLVREAAPLDRLASEFSAEREELVLREDGALAAQAFQEGRVARHDVVVAERRWLIRRAHSHG
jgi:hypothetical protein